MVEPTDFSTLGIYSRDMHFNLEVLHRAVGVLKEFGAGPGTAAGNSYIDKEFWIALDECHSAVENLRHLMRSQNDLIRQLVDQNTG